MDFGTNYASCLVVEKRKKGVVINRGTTIKYNRREVPDIPEIKEFLLW